MSKGENVTPEMQRTFDSMLTEIREGNVRASVLMVVFLILSTLLAEFTTIITWKDFYEFVGLMTFIATVWWGEYFLTRYRVRAGFFGSIAYKAEETIKCICKENPDKDK